MRMSVRSLLEASQTCSIGAIVMGLAAGFLEAATGPYVCWDSCPPPESYSSYLVSTTVTVLIPSLALEALALVAFVAYCLATGQAGRAIAQVVVALVGGALGGVALNAFLQHGQASVPLTSDGSFDESALETWQTQWGWALMLVVGAWSVILAWLPWSAVPRLRRPPAPPASER